MRTMFVVAGLALGGALTLPAAAFGSHDPSGEPFGEDFATLVASEQVCGFRNCGTAVTQLDARSGPSGENPTGQWTAALDGRPPFAAEPVICLRVEANHAVAGVHMTYFPGDALFFLEDNSATGEPDRWSISRLFGPVSACPAFGNRVLVNTGDIVVHDAPALPTSKDQCKNGGWKTFGVFKNQGDCVSFVATGGKNPPAGAPRH